MSSTILVTGGTGTLGRHVVPLLRDAGHHVRVLSRHSPDVACDLLKDEGIDAAVAGVDTIVHLAGSPKGDEIATENLMRAAKAAGVRHVVYISVTGAGQVPVGYFKMKFAAEQAVRDSGVPWTIVRAAQFHDLVYTVVSKLAKMPIVPVVNGLRFQPVDARDVAKRLAELAQGQPAGRVADIVGPRVYTMAELAKGFVATQGKRRLFVPMGMPGKAGRAYRDGANLTASGATVGVHTWESFVAQRLGASAK